MPFFPRSLLLLFAPALLAGVGTAQSHIYLYEDFDSRVIPPAGWFEYANDPSCPGWRDSYDARAEHAEFWGPTHCDSILWTSIDLRNATEAWVHADMEVWRVQELATHPYSTGDGSFQILVRPMGTTNWTTIWDDCRTRDRRDVVNARIPKNLMGGFADIGFRMAGTSPLVVRVDRVQVDDSPAPPFWDVSQIVWNVPYPSGVATAPYFQDFESGVMPPEMEVAELSAITWQPDPSAWCQIANTAGTGAGQYCLEMGTEPGYFGATGNIAVFKIDMSALTHPILSFKVRNWGDRTNNEDGVYVSADHARWFEVFDNWNGLPNVWTEVSVDLSKIPLPFKQQPIYLAFYNLTDMLPYGLGEGTGIDDIRIEDAPDPNCFQILTATGSCLQDITIEVEYPTPGGQVALIYGPPGTFTQTGTPCTGVSLDIGRPRVGYVWDPASEINCIHLGSLPPSACGIVVQAVDLANCCVSNSLTL